MKYHINFRSIKLLLITFMLCFSFSSFGTVYISFKYRGQWAWGGGVGTLSTLGSGSHLVGIRLNSGGLCYFQVLIDEWEWTWVNNITKKDLQEHNKLGKPFEFEGTVEYYVNDRTPTIEDVCKRSELVIPDTRRDETPCVKRVADCIIKILPTMDGPRHWEITLNNAGMGIELDLSDYNIKW